VDSQVDEVEDTEVEGMEWTEGVLVDEFGDEMEEELWTMGEE